MSLWSVARTLSATAAGTARCAHRSGGLDHQVDVGQYGVAGVAGRRPFGHGRYCILDPAGRLLGAARLTWVARICTMADWLLPALAVSPGVSVSQHSPDVHLQGIERI